MQPETTQTSVSSIEKIDAENSFFVTTTIQKRKMSNVDLKIFLQRQADNVAARAVKMEQARVEKAKEIADNLKAIDK